MRGCELALTVFTGGVVALNAQQPAASASFAANLQTRVASNARLQAMRETRLLEHSDSTDQAAVRTHDTLWNGILIGAVVGIPAAHLLGNMGGGLDSGDSIRATLGGAVLGAVIGLMIDTARTN